MSSEYVKNYEVFSLANKNTRITEKYVPCELQAPEDFLKRRYNLLDMSAMRVAYYGLDSWLSSL